MSELGNYLRGISMVVGGSTSATSSQELDENGFLLGWDDPPFRVLDTWLIEFQPPHLWLDLPSCQDFTMWSRGVWTGDPRW